MALTSGIEWVPNSSVSCSKPSTACLNLFSQIWLPQFPWTFSNTHIPSTQTKWTLILVLVHFPHTYLQAFAVMIFPPASELCFSMTWPFLSKFSNPVLAWRWIFVALVDHYQHESWLLHCQSLTASWIERDTQSGGRQHGFKTNVPPFSCVISLNFFGSTTWENFPMIGIMHIKCLPWSVAHSRCTGSSS